MNLVAMFLIGLAGSVHCIGMCGGFALTVGTVPLGIEGEKRRFGPTFLHQIIYSSGRLFTYGFLGAAMGLLGGRLARLDLPLASGQQLLAIVAGILMLYIGLNTLGVLRFKWLHGGGGLLTSMLRQFINSRGWGPFLLAGVFTGFLPCGLVYAALANAAESANPATGWLAMVVFGLGTIPAMVAIGCGGTLMSLKMRARVLQLAACFVILLGGMTIYRGLPIEENCCSADHAAEAGIATEDTSATIDDLNP